MTAERPYEPSNIELPTETNEIINQTANKNTTNKLKKWGSIIGIGFIITAVLLLVFQWPLLYRGKVVPSMEPVKPKTVMGGLDFTIVKPVIKAQLSCKITVTPKEAKIGEIITLVISGTGTRPLSYTLNGIKNPAGNAVTIPSEQIGLNEFSGSVTETITGKTKTCTADVEVIPPGPPPPDENSCPIDNLWICTPWRGCQGTISKQTRTCTLLRSDCPAKEQRPIEEQDCKPIVAEAPLSCKITATLKEAKIGEIITLVISGTGTRPLSYTLNGVKNPAGNAVTISADQIGLNEFSGSITELTSGKTQTCSADVEVIPPDPPEENSCPQNNPWTCTPWRECQGTIAKQTRTCTLLRSDCPAKERPIEDQACKPIVAEAPLSCKITATPEEAKIGEIITLNISGIGVQPLFYTLNNVQNPSGNAVTIPAEQSGRYSFSGSITELTSGKTKTCTADVEITSNSPNENSCPQNNPWICTPWRECQGTISKQTRTCTLLRTDCPAKEPIKPMEQQSCEPTNDGGNNNTDNPLISENPPSSDNQNGGQAPPTIPPTTPPATPPTAIAANTGGNTQQLITPPIIDTQKVVKKNELISTIPTIPETSTTGPADKTTKKLHGSYIQGGTGPEVLLYPLLIAGANGAYYIYRRRKIKS